CGGNVEYNSLMKWKIDDRLLTQTTLHAILYCISENNIEKIVGETAFKVGELYIFQPLTTWLNIRDDNDICSWSGEVLISLCYHPTSSRLTCTLVQARNLIFQKKKLISGIMLYQHCYATISLIRRNEIVKKTKTCYYRSVDSNPLFNETSTFMVTGKELFETFIRIVLFEITTQNSKVYEIGHTILGSHGKNAYK
ncbi:unnamed protein product, partial [Didymodactylos carnosus]